MLVRRLISAFVIVSVMLLLLRLDFWLGTDPMLGRPGIVLSLLAMIVSGMAAAELVSMWRNEKSCPDSRIVTFAAMVMTGLSCAPALWDVYPTDCPIGKFGWPLIGIVSAIALTFSWEMQRYSNDQESSGVATGRLARSALVYLYLGTLFSFLMPHRLLQDSNSIGLLALITLITTVKMSDAFAYFSGKAWGTIRIAPELSPNKTLQGSLGAIVGGCVGAAIVVYLVAPWAFQISLEKSFWWVVVYGLLVTLAGMAGDLAESLLKRDADCKDSSRWLPGLGGILDVIDSLIFAAPVSYALWIL